MGLTRKKMLWALGGANCVLALGLAVLAHESAQDEKAAQKQVDQDVRALAAVKPRSNPAIRAVFDDYRQCLRTSAVPSYLDAAASKRLAERFHFVPVYAQEFSNLYQVNQLFNTQARLACHAQALLHLQRTQPLYRRSLPLRPPPKVQT